LKYFLIFILSLLGCQTQENFKFQLVPSYDEAAIKLPSLDYRMKISDLIIYLDSLDCHDFRLIGTSNDERDHETADGAYKHSVNMCDSYNKIYNQLKTYYLNTEKLEYLQNNSVKGAIRLIANKDENLQDIIPIIITLRQFQFRIMAEYDLQISLVTQIETSEQKYLQTPLPSS
jgi:hypothetical protein